MTAEPPGTPSPAVIAHRGASAHARENTVEAFRLAVDQGADGIELDVRCTHDGLLVVHHDARLADGTDIATSAADRLPPHVPSLSAALDACEGAWVNLELKYDPIGNDETEHADERPVGQRDRPLAAAVVDLLAARPDPVERWLISSFDLATIDTVRALAPEIPTAFLVLEATSVQIEAAVGGGHRALHPYVARLDRAALDEAHRAGLAVNVWTCNDADRMRELIDWGVDGICTDLPDIARRLVDDHRR